MFNEYATIDPKELQTAIPTDQQHEKFGNSAEILAMLEKGEVLSVENIDEYDPRLEGHHVNEVDLAIIDAFGIELIAKDSNSKNLALINIEDQDGKKVIRAVFKPLSGENEDLRRNLVIDGFYKREKAAYILDQYLGFDLVPPTIIREIEGRGVGSLQFYIDKEVATPRGAYLAIEDEDEFAKYADMSGSEDWVKMAVFDWVIGNFDRNPWNILHLNDDKNSLVAIDHGSAWTDYCTRRPLEGKDLGPRYLLKKGRANQDYQTIETDIQFPVPEAILQQVASLRDHKDEINHALADLVTNSSEIEAMWHRIDEILEQKVIL